MNFTKIKIAAVTPLIALSVSACGGGSDVASRTYSELNSDAEQLVSRLETVGEYNSSTDEFENVTQDSEMPTTGTASYSGISGIWVGDSQSQAENNAFNNSDTPDVLSDLNLTADFDNGTIGGEMDNFRASTDDVSVSGNIAITNGAFTTGTGGEAGMTADMNGDLDVTEDGNSETVEIDGQMAGAFLGDTGEGLVGMTEGDMISGTGNGRFVGIFGAERD